MLGKICISFLTFLPIASAHGHCIDIHSEVVSQGLHYIPGPNPCTICQCDKGTPKWCKSVLCSPPQNCKSFQLGSSCCEYQCLDDILTVNDGYKETYDLALRLIASAVTAILSLSLLFFLLHRLRRRKIQIRQNRRLNEDQRSLNSIGYIAGSLGYLSGNIGYIGTGNTDIEYHYEEPNEHLSLWKPPGNYFPRDEAPPPYEEAVRAATAENELLNAQLHLANRVTTVPIIETVSQRSTQTPQQNNVQATQCQHEQASNNYNNHEYANINVSNGAVYQNCLKSESQLKKCEKSSYENVMVKSESAKQKVSERSKNVENQIRKYKYENVHLRNALKELHNSRKVDKPKVPDINTFYENVRHRTVPNLSEYQMKEAHKTKETTHNTTETNKHKLSKSRYGDRSENNLKSLLQPRIIQIHSTLPSNLRELNVALSSTDYTLHDSYKLPETDSLSHRSLPKQILRYETPITLNVVKSQINLLENSLQNITHKTSEAIASSPSFRITPETKPEIKSDSSASKEDDVSIISYQYLSSSQDEDDYRSECENCKSSGFTNDEETDILNETMTLQRRPLEQGEELPYYRNSVTLPTDTRKPRAVNFNPTREGWFVAMQETSSSDESE